MLSRPTFRTKNNHASTRHRGNSPDTDPEPPMAPPVIILSASGGLGSRENQGPAWSDPELVAEPRPHTSPPTLSPATSTTPRYNLRRKNKEETAPDPDPDAEPVPEPDSAPPIIILPNTKRPASSSPRRSASPSFSTTNCPSPNSPPSSRTRKMGSKASKLSPSSHSGHSKLQPTIANSDKEQMKEPPNYYSHRSKSMRRKAGRGPAGATPPTAP